MIIMFLCFVMKGVKKKKETNKYTNENSLSAWFVSVLVLCCLNFPRHKCVKNLTTGPSVGERLEK